MIHATAIIGPDVQIADDAQVGPFVYITGKTFIGSGVKIHAHASIGDTPQHRRFHSSGGPVYIGRNTVIREFVTIHAGTERETRVGADCYLMAYSHISHDTITEDGVTLANSVQIGGHSYIMRGANFGLGATVHQHQIIGSYSMIGMGCVVTHTSKIEPGCTYAGNPARLLGINHVGLERAGVSEDQLADEVERWLALHAKKFGS